ncbi:GntR family transcriptional regulator [Bradyrhizobium sp. LHD-71]|uniref:GntR family transcriptional regulator n=1 Tax=Bradyrhizobium sp. LHD-71 TaxID=3072141 RepID=UPI00280D1460|nr:GntR family transcriptional regulator [Bradyrhizobium sp. LHD-71]MDQ8728234.1 GntR family transcriptional regulator [Bradyrhizobium sp. LHD-71]
MNASGLRPGPVTLYAQLAAILRSRILSGAWRNGHELPNLDELAQEHSVARVTVRQAIQVLSHEGLLSSQRGRRTIVTYQPSDQPVAWSIGAVEKDAADFSVLVLSKDEVDGSQIPSRDIFHGTLSGKYVLVRKVDKIGGEPYAVSSNYVSSPLFRKFPRGAEQKQKLARLIKDHAGKTAANWQERVTVGTADYIEAGILECPLSAPVARVARICTDPAKRIIYVGFFAYIGSYYMIERNITQLINR